jgi:hypothetical protein
MFHFTTECIHNNDVETLHKLRADLRYLMSIADVPMEAELVRTLLDMIRDYLEYIRTPAMAA